MAMKSNIISYWVTSLFGSVRGWDSRISLKPGSAGDEPKSEVKFFVGKTKLLAHPGLSLLV